MRLGDLLIAACLVNPDDVERALDDQHHNGRRLGENLVAAGAISQLALDGFLENLPAEPITIADTGITRGDLLNLLIKLAYTARLERVRQFIEAIKLAPGIVEDIVGMAVDRNLLQAAATHGVPSLAEIRYTLTEQGVRWAQTALDQSHYAGPAPVVLEDFIARVDRQKITTETINAARLRTAFTGLAVNETFLERIGPALTSGRALLLYGPPGNGKTSVALRLADIFNAVIYIPYAVMIEGHVMRVFDPRFHRAVAMAGAAPAGLVRRDQFDARWVACRRPFVVAGGELTLAMLDLSYDSTTKFYEAPLHVKALGGCFLIDDFGRQAVDPTALLNRWIVPLENQIDFLRLHTGKTFSVPFEELVIFSTNLAPEDLMDPAFLRRLPYKLEIAGPSRDEYRDIFNIACKPHALAMTDEIFGHIVQKITIEKNLALAAYQPKFIVDQIVATARFLDIPPIFTPRFIAAALDNMKVNSA